MSYYKVPFKINKKKKYIYPKSIANIEWQTICYFTDDQFFIGQTNEEFVIQDKDIISLIKQEFLKFQKDAEKAKSLTKDNQVEALIEEEQKQREKQFALEDELVKQLEKEEKATKKKK